MIRIAIADDDAAFLAKIEKYIQKYQKENGEDIQLTAFSDAKELIEGYSPVYDIVILDIEMPGMNGMEAAEKIRQADEDVVDVHHEYDPVCNSRIFCGSFRFCHEAGKLLHLFIEAYKSYRADSENRKRDSLKAAGFGQEGSCGGNLLCGNTEQNVVLSHE